MGDHQGDLRPGTPILVGFFTEISKKWVLDSKTPLHDGEVNDMTCAFDMCFTCHFFDMRYHVTFTGAHVILHVKMTCATCNMTCTVTY